MRYASLTVTCFAVANTNPDNMCRKSLYHKKESIVQHLLTIFERLGACSADDEEQRNATMLAAAVVVDDGLFAVFASNG